MTPKIIQLGTQDFAQAQLGINYQNACTIYFIVTIESDELLTREEVQTATEKLQNYFPHLRLSVEKIESSSHIQAVESNAQIETLFFFDRENDQSCRNYYFNVIDKRCISFNNPQEATLRVCVFQNKNDKVKEIALEIPHVFVDATGLVSLTHRFLCFLFSGEANLPAGAVEKKTLNYVSSDDCMVREALRIHPSKLFFYLSLLKNGFELMKTFFYDAWGCATFPRLGVYSNQSQQSHCVIRKQFSKQQTDALLKLCRENQVTATTLVCGELFRASRSELGRNTLLCGMVSSVRRECSVGDEEMSNFISTRLIPFTWKKGDEDVWSRAQKIRRTSERNTSKYYLLTMAVLIGKVLRYVCPEEGQLQPTFSLSSWSAKGPIQAQYGNVNVLGGELMQSARHVRHPLFSMYTICGKLNVSLFYVRPHLNSDQLDRVLDDAYRGVLNLIE